MKPFMLRYSKTPRKTPGVSHLYLKLRSRLSLYFFTLIILPCILIAAAVFFHMRSIAEDKAAEMAFASISREMASAGKYIDELKPSIGAVADYLGKKKGSLSEAVPLNFTKSQQRSLSAVYIINEKGISESFGPDASHAAISNPAVQQWFSDCLADPGTVRLLGTVQRFYSEGANNFVLCMAKALESYDGEVSRTVLLFDFNYSLLSDFMGDPGDDGIRPENGAQRLIVDFSGNVLYCADPGKLTARADDALQSAVSASQQGFGRFRYYGRDYYLAYKRYPQFKWTLIDLNPASNVTGRLLLRSPVMTLGIILLPVLMLAYFGISLRLLKPINELTSVISDYENQFPGEIGRIRLFSENRSVSASDGTSDVDLLINKIYSIKLSQKEAELNSLQNQINPHFLYNTLESIRGAALYHGILDIASMSKALSLLFRYSISERVLVSIREELQHLENYISIQNFRFENKFEMLYSIPPELMNYKILKLTLQPLIENSIKHGLEMKLGKGTVRIEILELESNIKILISDDGLGISPRRLEELNRSLTGGKYQPGNDTDRSSTGIGVMNVNSRIKLYFGEQYGLKFREALAGTTVEITLPAVKEN